MKVNVLRAKTHPCRWVGCCALSFTHCGSGKVLSTSLMCNDQLPWRWESPQGLANLGPAIGLAPQSLGLLGGLRDVTGMSKLTF